jgi:hypothetical protein
MRWVAAWCVNEVSGKSPDLRKLATLGLHEAIMSRSMHLDTL